VKAAPVTDRFADEFLGLPKRWIGDDRDSIHLDRLGEVVADHSMRPSVVDDIGTVDDVTGRAQHVQDGSRPATWIAPSRVWFSSRRLPMMHRHGWAGPRASSNVTYCWMVWQSASSRGPIVDWFDWKDLANG
jgi:hypothetical protein